MKKTSFQPTYLNHAAAVCALGDGIAAIEAALFADVGTSPLQISADYSSNSNPQLYPVGRVADDYPATNIDNSRNNRLLQHCLTPLFSEVEALKARFGAHRIGVIVGSSTSGIHEAEQAEKDLFEKGHYSESYNYQQQEIGSPSRFAAQLLGINGPHWTISTACTSGAKALASAQRLLNTGLVDAVIAGGCDTLCSLTVQGFASLGALSDKISLPFSKNRSGINIGEAAAFFIVSHQLGPVVLAGCGESSDAHHISAPQPEGHGAEAAMRQALTQASLPPDAIDYVNLHGTATQQNDAMESKALARIFDTHSLACSSTKPLTGHTLGAAGALEAVFCFMALQRTDGRLPIHTWDEQPDPELPTLNGLNIGVLSTPVQHVISNSFAFGGNNIALLMSRSEV